MKLSPYPISLWRIFAVAIIVITALSLSEYEAICDYDVEVTWSLKSGRPNTHTVIYGGKSFQINPGDAVTLSYELRGGSNGRFIFSERGWGLGPSSKTPVLLDGQEVAPRYLRCHSSGTWEICGIAMKPKMTVEIIEPDAAPNGSPGGS